MASKSVVRHHLDPAGILTGKAVPSDGCVFDAPSWCAVTTSSGVKAILRASGHPWIVKVSRDGAPSSNAHVRQEAEALRQIRLLGRHDGVDARVPEVGLPFSMVVTSPGGRVARVTACGQQRVDGRRFVPRSAKTYYKAAFKPAGACHGSSDSMATPSCRGLLLDTDGEVATQ